MQHTKSIFQRFQKSYNPLNTGNLPIQIKNIPHDHFHIPFQTKHLFIIVYTKNEIFYEECFGVFCDIVLPGTSPHECPLSAGGPRFCNPRL